MGKSEESLIMRRITIQYLIPVQVKSSRGGSVPLGTWNLEGTPVVCYPIFSLLESGSPATLLSFCLSFFVFFSSCIGRRCKVVSTDSTSDYMYRTWLIHIHICIYIIFTLHMMHLSAGPVPVPVPFPLSSLFLSLPLFLPLC